MVVQWKLLNDCHFTAFVMCNLSTEQSKNKPGIMRSAARPGCPRNLQVTCDAAWAGRGLVWQQSMRYGNSITGDIK